MTGRDRARRWLGVDPVRAQYQRGARNAIPRRQGAREELEAWALTREGAFGIPAEPMPPDWDYLHISDSEEGWRPLSFMKVLHRHETSQGSVGMVMAAWRRPYLAREGLMEWEQWVAPDIPYAWATNAEIGHRPEVLEEARQWFSRKEPPQANIVTHAFSPRLFATTEAVLFYALEVTLEHFPPGAPPPDVFARWAAEHMDEYMALRTQAIEAGLPPWTAGLPPWADPVERPDVWRPTHPPRQPMPDDFPRPGLRRGVPWGRNA